MDFTANSESLLQEVHSRLRALLAQKSPPSATLPPEFRAAKVRPMYSVSYRDVNRLICRQYQAPPKVYHFAADQEVGNFTDVVISVPELEPLDEDDLADIERFRGSGRGSHITRTLFQDMVNRGVIPAGEYLVEVFW